MADWSNLPTGALLEISDRFENGIDYVRFRSICSSWRSGAPKRPQFPWLAVIYKGDIAGDGAAGLYDFPKPHFLKPQLPDGIPKDKVICGSSRGWISILHRADTITLHNPFTGAQIELPPFTNLPLSPEFCQFAEKNGEFSSPAYKLILSSDPLRSPSNCVVMGLMCFAQRLVFLLPGSDRWIVTPRLSEEECRFQDIVFYRGYFYAVSPMRLFVCDPASNDALVTEIPLVDLLPLGDGLKLGYYNYTHLVESSGDLLLLSITMPNCHDFRYGGYAGYACEVYQVELSGGHARLRRMNHLGGRSLFLGIGSMSVSAGTFPRCKYNQIYLIDHSDRPQGHPDHGSSYERRGNKIVVLNVEDGSYSTISTISDDINGVWWSAYWLTPSL